MTKVYTDLASALEAMYQWGKTHIVTLNRSPWVYTLTITEVKKHERKQDRK